MSTGEVARPWLCGRKRRGESRSPQNIRRTLFGPVDHEENLRYVREELGRIKERDSERWNFDFDSGKPLEGAEPPRYAWEPLAVSGGASEPGEEANRQNPTADTHPPRVQAEEGGGAAGRRDGMEQATGSRQTTITDFMRHRKSKPSSRVRKSDVTSDSDASKDSPAKVRRRAST